MRVKYDSLPPDVQEAIGSREDVIDQWVVVDKETALFHNAFVQYTKNDQGYDTWEEYRDIKGFGKQEEITIEQAQDVDSNDKPRETPAMEQDETLTLNK